MRRFRVLAVAVSLLCFSAVAAGQESGGGAESGGGQQSGGGAAERRRAQSGGGEQPSDNAQRSGGEQPNGEARQSGGGQENGGRRHADGWHADGAERAYEYATGNISGRDHTACGIGDERAAGFDAGSYADDDARSVDADVPRQRVCGWTSSNRARAAETNSSRRIGSCPWRSGGWDRASLTARVMLSLEPATIGDERYPLLFQQGETAYGEPIADGQHPHNFFMELAALYDLKLGEQSTAFVLCGAGRRSGDRPAAYPHRASAIENPVAALGHHQEDSTHIADDVVTVGLTIASRGSRLPAFMAGSRTNFAGTSIRENRFLVHAADDASRGKTGAGNIPMAASPVPRRCFPAENQERMTASVMYNRPLEFRHGARKLGQHVACGAARDRSRMRRSLTATLLESTLRFRTRNYAWTRIENVERSNELILGENPLPPGFAEQPVGRVEAYTLGFDRDIDLVPHLASAIGAQFTAYGVPRRFAANLRGASGGRHHVRALAAVFRAGEIVMIQSSS